MKKTALLLIAHGSRRSEANADLEHVADRLRARGHSITIASFLELAEPSILDGGDQCVAQGAQQIILVPYFLSAGVHVQQDLREARQLLAETHPNVDFHLALPLGRHPLLIEVVEQRVLEILHPQSPEK